MAQARQRLDLIEEGLEIPVFKDLESWHAGQVDEYVKLDAWTPGKQDEGELGLFFTDTGIFDTIDLEFKS